MTNKKIALYIVSTYYHALISCVKQLISCVNADIICTHYIPNGKELADKIAECGLFSHTYFIGKIEEYHPVNKLDYILHFHKKNASLMESQLPVDICGYDEINIFHDDIWAAHYLKSKHIKYRLIEDALDSFKNISKTCFSYMLPNKSIKTQIKRFFGIGYLYCGYDRFVYEVEVNDKKGVEIADFAFKKIIELPRKPLFDHLAKDDINSLCQIFLKDIPDIDPQNSILLLTQPLFVDSVVKSEKKQIEYYKNLVDKYRFELELVVKPHPRDTTDYSSVFPNAKIIDKNMPVEMLTLIGTKKFKKLVTYNSTCKQWIPADETIP